MTPRESRVWWVGRLGIMASTTLSDVVSFDGELVHRLALGNDDFTHCRGELERIFTSKLARSRDGFFGCQPAGIQDLGCSIAAGSPLAVVVPVDGGAHGCFMAS